MSERPIDRHDQDQTIDLLKFDYQVARSLIDKFENHVFVVRNWAVTTTGAIVAISLSATSDSCYWWGWYRRSSSAS